MTTPKFNGQLENCSYWKKQVTIALRKNKMEIWLNKVDANCTKPKEIDLSPNSIFHEATSARTMQKIVDGNRSSSGAQHWSIMNGWFDDKVAITW